MTCMRCAQLEQTIRELRAQVDKERGASRAPAGFAVSIEAAQIREVFDEWVKACKHPRAKLTADRRSKVRARLKEGYTTADLKLAVNGAARGAYTDARGHTWDDLSLICRSGSNVERFMELAGPNGEQLMEKFIA